MRKQSLTPFVNIVALGVTITVNVLANIIPLNGQTTGEISDRFASYIVPAGFTFGIWSVIYLVGRLARILPLFITDDMLIIRGWFAAG